MNIDIAKLEYFHRKRKNSTRKRAKNSARAPKCGRCLENFILRGEIGRKRERYCPGAFRAWINENVSSCRIVAFHPNHSFASQISKQSPSLRNSNTNMEISKEVKLSLRASSTLTRSAGTFGRYTWTWKPDKETSRV